MAKTLDDLYTKLDLIRMEDLFESEEDEETLAVAFGRWDIKTLETLWKKYKDVYHIALKKSTKESKPVVEPVKEEEPIQEEPIPESNDFIKAKLTYKKLARVLKYEMVKENALIKCDHTCFTCDKQYPTKDEFKAKFPSLTYPVFVRCNFPIIKYIEKTQQFDITELIKDKKIFNSDNYTAICLDCKPSKFAKR